jgi:F420-non-reducing hydrogenase large subunit
MGRSLVIDPVTRLEGHGKIVAVLDDEGRCERAYLVIPELRAFEKFAEGRAAEDMPQITSRICGVCPMAHHMASTKALDDLYKVEPPLAAKMIRELAYNVFMLEDHALHFYILSGPDFVVGPTAPKAERNVLGLIKKVGVETGLKVIRMRKKLRELNQRIAGRTIHPVFGVPGGVSKPVSEEDAARARELAKEGLEFSLFTLKVLKDVVLSNPDYMKLITDEAYTEKTYYMGLVDGQDRLNFYDGALRVVDPEGNEFSRFDVHDYLEHIGEHVEPWTYVRFSYLRKVGWKGFVGGKDSGIFAVAPLARLNVSKGMATPRAQEAYEEMYEALGGKPTHYTLAYHWARVVEMVYAAERIGELAADPELTDNHVREIPSEKPEEGIGVVEAPRGVLIHHYQTDEQGIIRRANLLVATQHNAARISMSINSAARRFIQGGEVDEGVLNLVEMAFRAYDPCHACATHSLPGTMPLAFYLYSQDGRLLKVVKQGG